MRFDSAEHAPLDRVERYARFNGPPSRVEQAGPNFSMQVARWRLDRIVLHERRAHDVIHARDGTEIADGLDHLMLHLLVSGGYQVDIGDSVRDIPEGALLLLDLQQPMRTRANDAHIITISLARDLAIATVGSIAAAHGRIVDGASVLPLSDYLQILCRHAALIPETATAALAQAIVPLVTVAIGAPTLADEAMSHRDPAVFDRAKRLIDAGLGNSRFDATLLAEQSGLSRSTLYRLFQASGGLMTYIRTKRLERIRNTLSNPEDDRPLAAIVAEAGFASEQKFARYFEQAYGVRPTAYRRAVASHRSDGGSNPRFGLWISELE